MNTWSIFNRNWKWQECWSLIDDDGNLHDFHLDFVCTTAQIKVWVKWINFEEHASNGSESMHRHAIHSKRTPTHAKYVCMTEPRAQELKNRTKSQQSRNSQRTAHQSIKLKTIFICSDLKHNIHWKIEFAAVVTCPSSDMHITLHLLTCLHKTPSACFPSWRKTQETKRK